jgi:hypothetical protein
LGHRNRHEKLMQTNVDMMRRRSPIAVMNGAGKIVMECVIETKATMILQFIDGLRGELQVTFEEGTSAAWLYDLLKPQVTKLVVCDPRKNASMREGNQSDKIDARRLVELLRLNHLNPVYHGEHGLRSLKELVRSYLTITKDLGRVNRCQVPIAQWTMPDSHDGRLDHGKRNSQGELWHRSMITKSGFSSGLFSIASTPSVGSTADPKACTGL